MPHSEGERLGPYEIVALIGAGGMGEVYKARDTRLDRIVAVKFSQERFSERVEQEARAVAALNHPHICQLFDVGPDFLVMEFVQGEPLQGPVSVEKATEYAGQILEALATAHDRRIIHRDLKPANILITKQGIKLLDFGLAKQNSPLKETEVTRALTEQGQIVGTLQYMSPEQLHGNEADARSDLFSFGCVLYEMLTGKRAFEGRSPASVIAAILEREPAPLNLTPPLERVLARCLAKDPDQRFQSARDLKTALTWAVEQPVVPKGSRRVSLAAAAAALMLGVLGGWAVSNLRQLPPDDRIIRFQIAPPQDGGIFGAGNFGGGFAISPDGRNVAFVGAVKGKTGVWVRPLEASDARLIPGTEGAIRPFWSPDSGSIAFAAKGALRRFDLSRQTESRICNMPGILWGGSWSSDGRILFGIRGGGIFQVAASGGTPLQVTTLNRSHGEIGHMNPHMLSGGRFLYLAAAGDSQSIYATSLKKPNERIRLIENAEYVEYASGRPGENYLLWTRDRRLVAQRFDGDKLQLIGEPHSLADPVVMASSGSGVLLYGSSITLRRFMWLDRSGNEVAPLGEPGPWIFSRISPDGRRIATVGAGFPSDIWLLETGRGVVSRLTSGGGIRIRPVWSPDGRTILYSSGVPFNLFRLAPDVAGSEERIMTSPNRQSVNDWSPDGRYIMYVESAPDTGYDLWVLPVTPEGRPSPGAKPWPFVHERFDQEQGRFSPDSHWVAYQSDETGQFEVYVRSFPEPHEKFRISTGGGTDPQWGSGGRELFYVSRDAKLMLVTLKLQQTSVEASLPRELFALPEGFSGLDSYEASPNGQRLLVGNLAASQEPLNVIINWPALLKKGAVTQ